MGAGEGFCCLFQVNKQTKQTWIPAVKTFFFLLNLAVGSSLSLGGLQIAEVAVFMLLACLFLRALAFIVHLDLTARIIP